MKPGNLRKRGAKSGGKRKMRIRYFRTSDLRCAVFYCYRALKTQRTKGSPCVRGAGTAKP